MLGAASAYYKQYIAEYHNPSAALTTHRFNNSKVILIKLYLFLQNVVEIYTMLAPVWLYLRNENIVNHRRKNGVTMWRLSDN